MTHWLFLLIPGGNASETDDITADGQHGLSFVNPVGEIFLHPLAGKIFLLSQQLPTLVHSGLDPVSVSRR